MTVTADVPAVAHAAVSDEELALMREAAGRIAALALADPGRSLHLVFAIDRDLTRT